MSTRRVKDCDRCGAQAPECIQSVAVRHPRKAGEMDAQASEWDFCPGCLAAIVRQWLDHKPEDECRQLIGGKMVRR